MSGHSILRQLTTARSETLRELPWDDYPRPLLRRKSYLNLNGHWDYTLSDGTLPAVFDRSILVPFPPESRLSGIEEHPPEGKTMCYRRCFSVDSIPEKHRLLLHCGGLDQSARFFLNGEPIGEGCTLTDGVFTAELPALLPGENELCILVTDNLRDRSYPYGKQTLRRGGMWYTPVSGIWQTVWLEWVPEVYLTRLVCHPTLTDVTVQVFEFRQGKEQPAKEGFLLCEGKRVDLQNGCAVIIPESPRLWTPETPELYRFSVRTPQDTAESYFALRTVCCNQVNGIPRLLLNGKPYFFHGLLDQGYWPDGLWTPASPSCYTDDILAMKTLGFNTLRKHIKVEPERFYYDCDRLGMLVFQDLINNGRYSFLRDTALPTLGLQRLPQLFRLPSRSCRERFSAHLRATVQRLYSHPCIVSWTIFNEGWGQHRSTQYYRMLKDLDPTRMVDTASGWFRVGKSDVESRHVYFRRFRLPHSKKPVVLSEFGGYVCKDEAHSMNPDKTYGYKLFADRTQWQQALVRLYEEQILPAAAKGLCGCIYTQLSDVEDETNGLLTYDRRVCKAEPNALRPLAEKLQQAVRVRTSAAAARSDRCGSGNPL